MIPETISTDSPKARQRDLDRSHRLVFLGVDPQVDPLRSDPRFADLVQRVAIGAKTLAK